MLRRLSGPGPDFPGLALELSGRANHSEVCAVESWLSDLQAQGPPRLVVRLENASDHDLAVLLGKLAARRAGYLDLGRLAVICEHASGRVLGSEAFLRSGTPVAHFGVGESERAWRWALED